MLDDDAVGTRVLRDVLADLAEPGFDTRIKFDVAPLGHQILAVDAQALLFRLLVHQVHVGDERIGLLGFSNPRALGPEIRSLDAELREKRIFLHRFGRQGAVEIVDQRDGFFGVGEFRFCLCARRLFLGRMRHAKGRAGRMRRFAAFLSCATS